jgi:CRP-like cAMP-binding protein
MKHLKEQEIERQIRTIISLTDEEFALFLTFVQNKKLKRKEVLLREGDFCKHVYFIKKGCIRYYHTLEGVEHTGQFFFENGWYTDLDSFLSGQASRQTIEALEASEIILLPKTALDQLYRLIPQFERFGRLMAEKAFLGLRNRTEMLSMQNPEERYLNLIKQRPKLIERIPQHYIASYLGIKPQSLSRIRKRISVKP